jgi:hypothetical protein
MHTKINTWQNDPNFLTHVIWSETSLGLQPIHLELLWNLSYAFTKKNKHNSRINISDNYKIVINSSEVCFGIKRQYAINFSYKNHLCRFCRNGKQFYKKIYIITLCNFLVQELVMTWHTTYPKISYRRFIDFEILQM